jgi:hypothetical protein
VDVAGGTVGDAVGVGDESPDVGVAVVISGVELAGAGVEVMSDVVAGVPAAVGVAVVAPVGVSWGEITSTLFASTQGIFRSVPACEVVVFTS